jgi:Ca-activated chloride channel family protein
MAGPQTVFGDAIGLAITVFARAEGVQDRVLSVLTDGNDTNSKVPPVRAAEIAHDQKITIYTVAVGDPTAAGEEKLDAETLKTVATTTGGRYSHASDRAALADIYTQLDALPTRPVQTLSHRPRRDLFYWPLALGLALSLAYHAAWIVRHAWSRPASVSPPAPVVTASVFAIWLDVQQLHFLRPWWLLALLPALLLVWAIRQRQDAARPWRGLVAPHLLPHLLTRGGPQRRLQPAHLLLCVWLLSTLAVAGPTWRHEPAPFAEDTSALVLAVKVTPTMLAQDIQPSRLARAAQKIHDLLAQRPGTLTALVAYAGSAHLVLPLTRDASLIESFAAELAPGIMPVEGDVAGPALDLANQQLQKSGRRGSILLVADSVAAEQLPLLTAYHQHGGAPAHIFAVGAEPGVPLPPDSPPAPALDRTALGKAASAASASLTFVSPDASDVQHLARHLATSIMATQPADASERWQDAGYWLVPVAALLGLAWFRPGWVVAWQ